MEKREAEKSKRRYRRKCEYCGSQDETVVLTEDPYNVEIYDDFTQFYLCDDCCQALEDEI